MMTKPENANITKSYYIKRSSPNLHLYKYDEYTQKSSLNREDLIRKKYNFWEKVDFLDYIYVINTGFQDHEIMLYKVEIDNTVREV